MHTGYAQAGPNCVRQMSIKGIRQLSVKARTVVAFFNFSLSSSKPMHADFQPI